MSRIFLPARCAKKQRGSSLVFVTIALTVLLGFFALAIDVAHYLVVRNELQNAADAAALSGASNLYPVDGVTNAPNFSLASSKALSAISLNSANNTLLVTGDTSVTGYWNITGSPTGLHATQGLNDLPAVQVIIKKSGAENGGGVASIFAGVLGVNSMDGAAVAVAVAGASPSFTSKSLFPVAISQCMYDHYWDSVANQSRTGLPVSFTIGSTDSVACPSPAPAPVAQWTLLGSSVDIAVLIENVRVSNLMPKISISDTLSIIAPPSSTDSQTYSDLANSCAVINGPCEYVLVPVVSSPLDPAVVQTVLGFACIHIISAVAGTPTVTLQMASIDNTPACKMSNSGGNGPIYGAAIPPKLVNYSGNPP